MRFLKLIAVSVAVLALAAAPAAAQKKPYKIGAAVYGLKGEFMQLWVNALKEHPAVKDGSVKLTIFDGKYDALTQNNQFETMVTQKFDGILFVPIDIQAGAQAVEKAAEAKIPVVGSNARVLSDKLVSYVGSDDTVAGALEAEAVIKAMGGKGNVVIIEGPIGQSAQIERRKGNQAALAKYKDVKVLEMRTANWSRAEALSLMENWLTAHAGKIHGVIGQNDEMALGAIEALKAKGLSPKSIPVAGIDGVTDAIRAVKEGHMMSILQDAQGQAQGGLDVLLRHIVGPGYEPRAALWNDYASEGLSWGDGTARQYNVPWTPITLQNADALLAKRSK
ncbi:substrate-binding domain-containing protein [Verminephrobacter aporrectodeae]|uniref:substrate-binding domain-containing protein n=1 Tax=Verminephrobacter aporrectodeae TaxID=1110389 RepID=UPI0002377A91|nr:substrate-binding domain-containing protein [Verminephrobacter aporrectodeae]MCW5221774.1 sugar ABC transporter substrate-binding protein [Verminephrobacter aporrectodeae subsp. tuberculatae]MCW5291064.1 sugar ABC transporter substrate-binding protein [Verminephrobacter aporrectodeae subsp. tuberculatae]MCW8166377.1 sugar ABC transporter substrate-binding protein [Verminephrobacter aporrectodeae subsp. tuberculatae]MCW8170823.1 sugar ABC transporter substrate-binding protein [Verminephrobact